MAETIEYYKTGQAAVLISVTSQTLRDWHEKEVFIPEIVKKSNHRLYSKEQIEKFIKETMENKN